MDESARRRTRRRGQKALQESELKEQVNYLIQSSSEDDSDDYSMHQQESFISMPSTAACQSSELKDSQENALNQSLQGEREKQKRTLSPLYHATIGGHSSSNDSGGSESPKKVQSPADLMGQSQEVWTIIDEKSVSHHSLLNQPDISDIGSSKSLKVTDIVDETFYDGTSAKGSEISEIESFDFLPEEGESSESEVESSVYSTDEDDTIVDLENATIRELASEVPPGEKIINDVPEVQVVSCDVNSRGGDSDSGEEPRGPSLQQDLAEWAVGTFATHATVNRLLAILRRHGHSELPKTAKTLLKTPRKTSETIRKLCGGEFWYGGIVEGIKSRLSFRDLQKIQGQTVIIDIFVDGISPYTSVKKHLCVIAGCIVGSLKPFEIALWCGTIHEPNNVDQFFEDFIREATTLMAEGFTIDGISAKFSFAIDKFIADALARAWMLRYVVPPHAFYCCERCTVKGIRTCSRTLFDPHEEGILRTDESLINRTQKEHHHDDLSPLLQLGLKPLSQCPLEPMHNVFLGVTRRFFVMLFSTKKRVSKVTLKKPVIEKLSNHLISLKPYYPSEYNRKLRPLVEYTIYKASEFRRLSIYDAFLLLRQLELKKIADVHCLLGCAIRILSDEDLIRFRADADRLLRKFVVESTKLFGELFPTFNVHCLIHLADETSRHGCLNSFSAWKYETYLGQIKNMLRAPGRTLQQIVCRISEKRAVYSTRRIEASVEDNAVCVSQPHQHGPTIQMSHEQFLCMSVRNLGVFRVYSANDLCFVSKSGKICVLRNIIRNKAGHVSVLCNEFIETGDFFKYPLRSKLLGICTVKTLSPLKSLPVSEMKQKAVLLPLNEGDIKKEPTPVWMKNLECLCLPMLHHPSHDNVSAEA